MMNIIQLKNFFHLFLHNHIEAKVIVVFKMTNIIQLNIFLQISIEANDVIPDTKFQAHGKLEKSQQKNVVHYFAALQPDEVRLG
jgi:hypothetical protein